MMAGWRGRDRRSLTEDGRRCVSRCCPPALRVFILPELIDEYAALATGAVGEDGGAADVLHAVAGEVADVVTVHPVGWAPHQPSFIALGLRRSGLFAAVSAAERQPPEPR